MDLIGQVKKMLVEVGVNDVARLELIDELYRLGISWHFEDEIIQILNSSHRSGVDPTDLYSTSLGFRLLRQYGVPVSQGAKTSFIIYENFYYTKRVVYPHPMWEGWIVSKIYPSQNSPLFIYWSIWIISNIIWYIVIWWWLNRDYSNWILMT